MDEADSQTVARRRPLLRALAWAVAGLLALAGLSLWAVDTGPGHRLIADRIATIPIRSGLRIQIGRIDGSIWDRAVLRDVRLYDLKGQFFEAPEIRLDWRPFAWLRNRLDIRSIASDLVTLDRLPVLRAGRPGQPLLPGFDIAIGRLHVTRLRLGRAVAGSRADARIDGSADIRDGRALIRLAAASDRRDRLRIDLDAAPEGNSFHLAADVDGPGGGVLGGLFGTRNPIRATIGGAGGWHRWDGRAQASLAGRPVADLALAARDGLYGLAGTLAPAPFLSGKTQRLTAPAIQVRGHARLADRKLSGDLALATPALRLAAQGMLDLAESRFAGLGVDAQLLRPAALFPNMSGRDVHLRVDLTGAFATPDFRYALKTPHVAFDQTGFDDVRATGAGRVGRAPIAVPIRLAARRVTGLGTVAGGILGNLAVEGVLHVDAKTLVGEGLALRSDKLRGKLGLRIDLVTGRYDVALSGGLQRYLIPGLGIVDVDSVLSVVPGPGGRGTIVSGRGVAAVRRFDNAFLASLTGGLPRITTQLVRDPDGTLRFTDLVLTGPAIRITGTGMRRRDGTFKFDGRGRQATYGTFRIGLDGQIDRPQIRLLLDAPLPALGLANVALDLDPAPLGFAFRANGQSYVGPFTATGQIRTPPGQPTFIDIANVAASGTRGSGTLRSDPGGFTGRIVLAGGGISGAIGFAPQGTIQRIEPHLAFDRAAIAAAVPITVRRGRADGVILLDPAGTSIVGTASASGLVRGGVTLARLSADARLRAGQGVVHLAFAGSRGRAFDLRTTITLAPERIGIEGGGTIDQRAFSIPQAAMLTPAGDGGWQLAPTRFTYGGGSGVVGGVFGGSRTSIDATLDRMPLTIADMVAPGLGLGGTASGKLSYRGAGSDAPTGRLDMTVRGLVRSGIVRASQPIDVGLTALLTPQSLAMRAVAVSGGRTIGRAQARIAPLGPGADVVARIVRAPLFAQFRYAGPGDTLWRLTGVETIDLSGPLALAADAGGTLESPSIRGTLRTDAGRIESAVTGTVVNDITARGRFEGSRLVLDTLSGSTPGGGTVSGRGAFDLAGANGVGMELTLQAQDAQLLNRDEIGATVTGPIAIRSTGQGGLISGDVVLDKSRYQFGSTSVAQVARLDVTELNRGEDDGPADAAPPAPWQLDIKARAPNRLIVRGLGLDSEWRANLTIRGQVDNPAIGGKVDLVRGGYQFAGRRFTLERGTIRFTGDAPPDPILDISAKADIQGLNATIQIAGTALKPQISFQSIPAMPEDELLARLLFGTSITNLSAPEALQLAAAVASLRSGGAGGGGLNLDPINAVRRAVRLDRLRILPADVATGQKTSVAAGKYLGRRTYVEVVTDGAGYSATSVEFRITRWLSLLSSISTIGRQSASVRVSKDY